MSGSKRVIVVGAGVSGLSSAVLLARRGLEVTVVEGGDRPGGSCSAFRRQGVTFDLGAAMLFGFGERGFNPHRWLFEEIGESLDVYRHEALYRLHYGSQAVTFWPDLDRFLEELCGLFPEAKGELEAFYAAMGDIYERVIAKVPVFEAPTEIPREESQRRFMADPLPQLKALLLLLRNAESLMRPYVKDRAVRRFFDKLTSTYCYTTMRETPAILAATMFVDNHVGGSWYPASSPMALAARLEKALEAAGGRIRYRDPLVSLARPSAPGGAPRAVLASGEILEAEAILYAGAVKALAERLDPEGLLSPAWKRRILKMDDSFPSFVVYGTVDKAVLPADTLPVEMFVDNTEALDEGDVTLYLSGLEDPSLAPEGVSTFLLIGPSFRKWPRPGEVDADPEAYAAAKEAEARRMLALVEARKPGFTASVKGLVTGSPRTIERYLYKPRGSVAGPKQRMGQHLMFRPGARTKVPGLYLAGEGTVMGTGTPAVTVSGISAANALLRDWGLEAYTSSPPRGGFVRTIPRGRPGNLPPTQAGREAAACQWCEKAPCALACPAHLDIPGLMRRLEAGNALGAGRILAEAGRPCLACPAARNGGGPCEEVCVGWSFAGKAVPIRSILTEAGGAPTKT